MKPYPMGIWGNLKCRWFHWKLRQRGSSVYDGSDTVIFCPICKDPEGYNRILAMYWD